MNSCHVVSGYNGAKIEQQHLRVGAVPRQNDLRMTCNDFEFQNYKSDTES
jgi:hypothetical protein